MSMISESCYRFGGQEEWDEERGFTKEAMTFKGDEANVTTMKEYLPNPSPESVPQENVKTMIEQPQSRHPKPYTRPTSPLM